MFSITSVFGSSQSLRASGQFTSSLEVDDSGKKARERRGRRGADLHKGLVRSFIRQAATSTFMLLCSHSGANKNSPVRLPWPRSHFHARGPGAGIKSSSRFHEKQNGTPVPFRAAHCGGCSWHKSPPPVLGAGLPVVWQQRLRPSSASLWWASRPAAKTRLPGQSPTSS